MFTERPVRQSRLNVESALPYVTIYSDGSYKPNINYGGYGSIMQCGPDQLVIYGGIEGDSNNRMELLGVLTSLRRLTHPCEVLVVSDSQYVVNGLQGYVWNWIARDWKTSAGKPVANRDLWEEMLQHMQIHNIHAEWIKGHAGHPANETCDRLATLGAFESAQMPFPGTKDQIRDLHRGNYPGAEDEDMVIDLDDPRRNPWKKK